jgi:LemA protein
MTAFVVAAAAALGLLLAITLSYNHFVRQKQLIANSWSNVDTELRRRYDLIPNLVETVRGYAAHERDTLEDVVRARTAAVACTGGAEEQGRDENALVDALQHLLAVAEQYPDLRANEQFLALQTELINTEDRIQAARRFYNANVRDYNRRVESLPSLVVALLFGFRRADYFEVEPALRAAGAPAVVLEGPPLTE